MTTNHYLLEFKFKNSKPLGSEHHENDLKNGTAEGEHVLNSLP